MKTLIAIAAAVIPFCASANSLYLYSESSLPGETMDSFVVRISPRANEYTKKSGHEVCAAIRNNGSGYSVEVTTSSRNDECMLPADTEVYLHTHPINQGMGFSRGDYVRPGYLITEVGIKYQDGVNRRPRKVN